MVAERTRRELYVEGGGDRNPSLASECRKAFSRLFEKAGIQRKPRVIACGGRDRAYKQFCGALADGNPDVWLLVDAEELPVVHPGESPWDHVKSRTTDGWNRPSQARDEQLHLMTVCMETWLATDTGALQQVFGPKLAVGKLPPIEQLESTAKPTLYRALEAATQEATTGPYGKSAHSFKILAHVSPDAIRRLRWGKRFLDVMAATR